MMRSIKLNKINPDMFSLISKYIQGENCTVMIFKDGKPEGCLTFIAYFPRMSSDNTGQIRYCIKEEMGERRLYCRDNDGTDLSRYSISY